MAFSIVDYVNKGIQQEDGKMTTKRNTHYMWLASKAVLDSDTCWSAWYMSIIQNQCRQKSAELWRLRFPSEKSVAQGVGRRHHGMHMVCVCFLTSP